MKMLLFFSMLFFLIGCGDSGTTNYNSEPIANYNSEPIAGSWKSSCWLFDGTSYHYTLSYDVDSKSDDANITMNFSENSCSNSVIAILNLKIDNIDVVGNAEATGVTDEVSRNINGLIKEATLTLKDTAFVVTANLSSECGYSDWNYGVSKSILGKTCGALIGSTTPFYSKDTQIYYKINHTKTTGGSESVTLAQCDVSGRTDCLSSDKRPSVSSWDSSDPTQFMIIYKQ